MSPAVRSSRPVAAVCRWRSGGLVGGEHTGADASDGAREYARCLDLSARTSKRDREIAAAIDERIGRGNDS
jgi:hypothetical protein